MIEAVIFDVGGVLTYEYWLRIFAGDPSVFEAFKHLPGLELSDFAEQQVRLANTWKIYADRDRVTLELNFWQGFIDRFGLKHTAGQLAKLSDTLIQPISGMMQLVEDLHDAKVPLAICSDNSEFWYYRQA